MEGIQYTCIMMKEEILVGKLFFSFCVTMSPEHPNSRTVKAGKNSPGLHLVFNFGKCFYQRFVNKL